MDGELKDALLKIIRAGGSGNILTAKAYAQSAICNPKTRLEMEGEELYDHLSRVLVNIKHWKGYDAQIVKDTIREQLEVSVW